jgi:hypothetical protein
MIIVLLVLTIACVNLADLARGAARRRRGSPAPAIGGACQLIRQLLTRRPSFVAGRLLVVLSLGHEAS